MSTQDILITKDSQVSAAEISLQRSGHVDWNVSSSTLHLPSLLLVRGPSRGHWCMAAYQIPQCSCGCNVVAIDDSSPPSCTPECVHEWMNVVLCGPLDLIKCYTDKSYLSFTIIIPHGVRTELLFHPVQVPGADTCCELALYQ